MAVAAFETVGSKIVLIVVILQCPGQHHLQFGLKICFKEACFSIFQWSNLLHALLDKMKVAESDQSNETEDVSDVLLQVLKGILNYHIQG